MEKLAGDLLLGLKFVKLDILSTSFICKFLCFGTIYHILLEKKKVL